jgi:hypothetical protein
MAHWLEGIQESAFKRVSGGYVFQSANPWLFARPHYYLVNDAQKAVIGECLRKRAVFALFGLLAFVVTMALAVALIVYLRPPALSPLLVGISVAALLLIPVLIVPHIYLMRMLGPIIRNLPTTDQRITTSERLPEWPLGRRSGCYTSAWPADCSWSSAGWSACTIWRLPTARPADGFRRSSARRPAC